MIEIPRVYRHNFSYVARPQSVTQVEASSIESPHVPHTERRSQDRRQHKKKVVIERRLAPDRRGPRFKAEV